MGCSANGKRRTDASYTRVHGQRYKNQLQDIHEDPKKAGTTNRIQWGKKVMLLPQEDARPHTNAATSAV